ncbi:hypothetical protein G6F43_001556 [Rhizopus delemar]|nr:hypothetical protein G6F43_001556 [Rhizopus delemar]
MTDIDSNNNEQPRLYTEIQVLELLQHLKNEDHYKREVSKYYNEEWTMAEDINKSFLLNLKAVTTDTAQVVNLLDETIKSAKDLPSIPRPKESTSKREAFITDFVETTIKQLFNWEACEQQPVTAPQEEEEEDGTVTMEEDITSQVDDDVGSSPPDNNKNNEKFQDGFVS